MSPAAPFDPLFADAEHYAKNVVYWRGQTRLAARAERSGQCERPALSARECRRIARDNERSVVVLATRVLFDLEASAHRAAPAWSPF